MDRRPLRNVVVVVVMVSLYCVSLCEPNSRSSLDCEQQYPSKLVHLEDELSRHRIVLIIYMILDSIIYYIVKNF